MVWNCLLGPRLTISSGSEVVATLETPPTRRKIVFRVEWCRSRKNPTARLASTSFLSEDARIEDVAFAALPVDEFRIRKLRGTPTGRGYVPCDFRCGEITGCGGCHTILDRKMEFLGSW